MVKSEVIPGSFKQRVQKSAIKYAKEYNETFVKYDYLICSEVFHEKGYVEIKAEATNYLHLLGINTNLTAKEFFDKCLTEKLCEYDFDFNKSGQTESSVKGSVRQKIKVLPEMMEMLEGQLFVEKEFNKNKVFCAFATAKDTFTIGFVETGRPKTLMKNNQLNKEKCKPVDLIIRKERKENKYSEIVFGSSIELEKYRNRIISLIQ